MPDPFRPAFGAVALGLVVLAAVGWSSTRLGEYSVMSMGHVVDGHAGAAGSPPSSHHGTGAGARSAVLGSPSPTGEIDVTSLVADPSRPADVMVQLTARRGLVRVPGGRSVDGYTVNGTSPGPTIRARRGDLVQVTLVNESVSGGTSLHWHGVDVPNAADGVAGVTQDAVPVGGRFVYRFVAPDAGTYWYHSHQMSHEQVERGLFGAVVISEPSTATPGGGAARREPGHDDIDTLAVLHVFGGQHTLNGAAQDGRLSAPPGARVRVRVVNTDQGTAAVWASVPYRVAATDGSEVSGPTDVVGKKVLVAAGARVDLTFVVPDSGTARVRLGGARSLVLGPEGASVPDPSQPRETLDLLGYGTQTPLGFDAGQSDRVFDYVIGRRIGIVDGRPGTFWTINGHMFPDVPMFHVRMGDVVTFRVVNDSGEVHPMHLHGHHAVVRSRDGVAAQGSPWTVDSLDVHPGESYELAFVADNPGIWSDHCHTLAHAVDGLIAHLMYDGVTTPFTIGGARGNHPE